MRKTLILTISLVFVTQVALSQEPQGGTGSMAVGSQFQAVPPPINQFPQSPSNPLPVPQPTDQFAPPQVNQFQAPPPNGQFQPPPAYRFPMPPPAYQGPIPPPADDGLILRSNTIVGPKTEPSQKLWEGGLELGMDGSEGNSQNFNLHFGAKLKRKTEFNSLSSELDYKTNNNNSVETANKAFLESRFEHLFQQSPWTWFVHNIEDYDKFKAYDLRVSLDTGIGYQFIKNDSASLIGRFGGGTTREIGGPDDKFVPEAVFGLEGEYKISKRQKFCTSVEYRPDVANFADYRLNTKAAWEVLLDEEMHLSMKVGILDRYDSYSDGSKPNDLDYTLTLLWSL